MNLDDFIITCFCLIDEMVPMIGLVAIIIIVTLPHLQTVAHAATKTSKFNLQTNPQGLKPTPPDTDYCLSVIINSGNLSVVKYSIGVGQNYEVLMKVVNTCGVTLNNGGRWNFQAKLIVLTAIS